MGERGVVKIEIENTNREGALRISTAVYKLPPGAPRTDIRPAPDHHARALLRAAEERGALRVEVDELQRRLALAEVRETALASERDALLASSSWRLTRPLRVISRLFSGLHARTGPIAPDSDTLPAIESDYDRWVRECDTMSDLDRAAIRQEISVLSSKPVFSLLHSEPVQDEACFRALLEPLQKQLYEHWELLVPVDTAWEDPLTARLRDATVDEPRVRWIKKSRFAEPGLSADIVDAACGVFAGVIEPIGRLAEQALFEFAALLAAAPATDIIYSDEDNIGEHGRRCLPFFKPDWDIDLALAYDMTGHLTVFRTDKLRAALSAQAASVNTSGLVLQVLPATRRNAIRHLGSVLYHRAAPADHKDAPPADGIAHEQATRGWLAAAGHYDVESIMTEAGTVRLKWPLPDPAPRVSIIIPTRDRADLLGRCIAGLLYRTDYPDFEILIVDNESADPETFGLFTRLRESDPRIRVLRAPGPFNYAAMNNRAALVASGEILLLLNNDVEVIDSGWLRELVSHAIRPDVGAVGARLLYGNGQVQHAGVVLGVGMHDGGPGVAGHFGLGEAEGEAGYLGQFAVTHEVSAVTGACLCVRRDLYTRVGGLDAKNLAVSFNDVDLCLRIRDAGFRVIWTPFAELLHLESVSRGRDSTPDDIARAKREADYMRSRWGDVLDHDPFYNANFDRADHRFRLRRATHHGKPWQRRAGSA